MPEGDTLFRTALVLRDALGGHRVVDFASSGIPVASGEVIGRTVVAVDARGKNLLIEFDDGHVLHTHLRMTGSWHLYGRGQPYRIPERRARVILTTERHVAVCFSAPVVRWMTRDALAHDPSLVRLGPDLLAGDFSEAEALTRLRSVGHVPLGESVLMQSVIAGIGNVYKSEVLFIEGLDPFAPVSAFSDDELLSAVRQAKRLMTINVERRGSPHAVEFREGLRATRFDRSASRYWVYKRKGRPCPKCAAPILMRRQGVAGRSTYYCGHCQSRRVAAPEPTTVASVAGPPTRPVPALRVAEWVPPGFRP